MNLRSVVVATVAMIISSLSVPAYAKGEWKAKQAAYSRKVMQEFAKCVVERYPAIAREFVLMGPYEWVESKPTLETAGQPVLH